MIEDRMKAHDKYQFELKLGYNYDLARKKNQYHIDAYFFLSQSLDVNPATYSKNDFYSDIQTYNRFKTPQMVLRDILGKRGTPYDRLKQAARRLARAPTPDTKREYVHAVKLFCSIVKSALRDLSRLVLQQSQQKDIEHLVDDYIKYAEKIARYYRQLRTTVNVPSVDKNLFAIYCFGDEYISLLIEKYVFKMLDQLGKHDAAVTRSYRERLLLLVKSEVAYRKKQSYPSVPSKKSDNSFYVYRKSVLKKYMASVLFLRTHREPEGKLVKQLSLAFAAALAATVATVILFFSQYRSSGLAIPLLVGIIAYSFKDRIKDGLRKLIAHSVHKRLYDFKKYLYRGSDERIGTCRESFDFIPEERLPPRILALRDRDHLTQIENEMDGEKILLYRKQITIPSKKVKRLYRDLRFDSVNDIIRFDVHHFLRKMDDPLEPVHIVENGDYTTVNAKRIYHINLIVKYSHAKESVYKRYRILLNRDGIKNIEKVLTDREPTPVS